MPRHDAIATVGIVLLTITAGTLAGSAPAEAQASLSELSIGDAERTIGPNGAVTDVVVDVTATYEWDSTHQPDAVTATLYAAPQGGSFAPVDEISFADPGQNASGTATLSGGLVAAGVYPQSAFDPAEGAQATATPRFKLVLKLTRGGERIGLANVATQAAIVVSRDEMTVSARIGGSGSMVVETA